MTEVYGVNAMFETCRDKLVTQLTALSASMATGYDPTYTYVYDQHCTVPILLNAVSVQFDIAEAVMTGLGGGIIYGYDMTYSIRVHTGYEGQFNDNIKNGRLLNSIDNWLATHKDLGDAYNIIEILKYKTDMSFPESATIGSELQVMIRSYLSHIQI